MRVGTHSCAPRRRGARPSSLTCKALRPEGPPRPSLSNALYRGAPRPPRVGSRRGGRSWSGCLAPAFSGGGWRAAAARKLGPGGWALAGERRRRTRRPRRRAPRRLRALFGSPHSARSFSRYLGHARRAGSRCNLLSRVLTCQSRAPLARTARRPAEARSTTQGRVHARSVEQRRRKVRAKRGAAGAGCCAARRLPACPAALLHGAAPQIGASRERRRSLNSARGGAARRGVRRARCAWCSLVCQGLACQQSAPVCTRARVGC